MATDVWDAARAPLLWLPPAPGLLVGYRPPITALDAAPRRIPANDTDDHGQGRGQLLARGRATSPLEPGPEPRYKDANGHVGARASDLNRRPASRVELEAGRRKDSRRAWDSRTRPGMGMTLELVRRRNPSVRRYSAPAIGINTAVATSASLR